MSEEKMTMRIVACCQLACRIRDYPLYGKRMGENGFPCTRNLAFIMPSPGHRGHTRMAVSKLSLTGCLILRPPPNCRSTPFSAVSTPTGTILPSA